VKDANEAAKPPAIDRVKRAKINSLRTTVSRRSRWMTHRERRFHPAGSLKLNAKGERLIWLEASCPPATAARGVRRQGGSDELE
jgi:hypothetical protein